jgi:hypothetical protein
MKNNKNTATKVASIVALISSSSLSQDLLAQAESKQSSTISEGSKRNMNLYYKVDIEYALVNQKQTLVGILKGEPVFKNGKGELFTMNVKTGDIIPLNQQDFDKTVSFLKHNELNILQVSPSTTYQPKRVVNLKIEKAIVGIKVLGIDLDGHIIQETPKGEKFFLDPNTGDMIDFVGHTNYLKNLLPKEENKIQNKSKEAVKN